MLIYLIAAKSAGGIGPIPICGMMRDNILANLVMEDGCLPLALKEAIVAGIPHKCTPRQGSVTEGSGCTSGTNVTGFE